jgi:DNA-binding LacI/PurR family transcriptional regulator
MMKKANIYDVARLAEVSHQTVSRVLNKHASVKPATREKSYSGALY